MRSTTRSAQLRLAISLGVPTGPDDEESRLLYELDAFVGSSPAFRVLSSAFFDRQVALYEQVLEGGAASGVFELAAPADSLARGIVAMEDGLGLQVVIGHPGLDNAAAERILLRTRTATPRVTGTALGAGKRNGAGPEGEDRRRFAGGAVGWSQPRGAPG